MPDAKADSRERRQREEVVLQVPTDLYARLQRLAAGRALSVVCLEAVEHWVAIHRAASGPRAGATEAGTYPGGGAEPAQRRAPPSKSSAGSCPRAGGDS